MATSVNKLKKVDSGGGKANDGWEDVPVSGGTAADDGWEDVKKPVDLLGAFNRAGYKTATPGFFRDALHGMTGLADEVTLGNLQYSKPFRDALYEAKSESPASTTAGKVAGMGLLGLGTALAPEAVGPLVLAGAQGAATRPEGAENLSLKEDIARRGMGGAIGVGIGGAGKLVGSGAKKIGDWAMQNAVRLPEYIPGMGTRIADEGLIGTRGMMQSQVENKLAAREAAIQAALPKVQGTVPNTAPSSAIDRIGAGYVPNNPELPIPSQNQPFVDAAHQRSLEAVARGNLSPGDALNVARTIDKAAYDTSVPMGRFQRELGKAEGGALRQGVKDLANAQGIPQVEQNLASQQALINAREGLDRSIPLRENLMRYGRHGMAGLLAGEAMGHGNLMVPLAVGGTAALTATPLAMSTLGQAATKAGQAIPYAQPGFIDAMVRRSMEDQQ